MMKKWVLYGMIVSPNIVFLHIMSNKCRKMRL